MLFRSPASKHFRLHIACTRSCAHTRTPSPPPKPKAVHSRVQPSASPFPRTIIVKCASFPPEMSAALRRPHFLPFVPTLRQSQLIRKRVHPSHVVPVQHLRPSRQSHSGHGPSLYYSTRRHTMGACILNHFFVCVLCEILPYDT